MAWAQNQLCRWKVSSPQALELCSKLDQKSSLWSQNETSLWMFVTVSKGKEPGLCTGNANGSLPALCLCSLENDVWNSLYVYFFFYKKSLYVVYTVKVTCVCDFPGCNSVLKFFCQSCKWSKSSYFRATLSGFGIELKN